MKISAAILCVLLSASAFARDTIVFGIISYDTPLSSISNQTLLVRYIEQKADIAVRVITLKNDEETVNAFKNGIVDIAWIGTYQYMKYRTQLFAYPLVKPVHFGRSYYRSLFVTHRDSGIQTLSDLSGKTVAFVSSQSEAGYIYPVVMLAQNRMYEGEQYYAR
ncbi:MAG: PhnD/SsuA/transferrin family substrate-binding protein, partial [Spirochaetota bacterium]